MHMSKNKWILACLLVAFVAMAWQASQRPTLFLIGDSTVKNGQGDGRNGLWGWGSVLSSHFDTTRIQLENHALGGTSTRTFISKGLWYTVLLRMKKGDFLLIQFGHNDGGPLDDTARARGTLSGIGEETKEIYNPITKQQEVVHTYGWYLEKFVQEAKEKGVEVTICSPIPRNQWEEGKLRRNANSYPDWAGAIARRNAVGFIDLNSLISDRYDQLGQSRVAGYFTSADHTHTSLEGAVLNAETVAAAIRAMGNSRLKTYLKQ